MAASLQRDGCVLRAFIKVPVPGVSLDRTKVIVAPFFSPGLLKVSSRFCDVVRIVHASVAFVVFAAIFLQLHHHFLPLLLFLLYLSFRLCDAQRGFVHD